MQTIASRMRAIVAAAAALLVLAVPARADDLSLRIGSGAAPSTPPTSSYLRGPGPGIGTDGNAGLNLNSPIDDQPSSTNFQSNQLTVPDALNRLSIHSDTAGKPSVIYKFVNTKF